MRRKYRQLITPLFALPLFAWLPTVFAWTDDQVLDSEWVNGHPGFLSAWRINGPLDRPVIIAKGYDNENDDHPIDDFDEDFEIVMQSLTDQGFDIIIFDYVDGEADLKNNADNLAEFIRLLDTTFEQNGYNDTDADGHPDYDLALIGGSMGGIVGRTLFVQEYESMGVDTFITIDSPHHGVHLSPFIEWVAEFLDTTAGHQMLYGDPAYTAHYSWLRSVEADGNFLSAVIDPMNTAAIALSDGESSWELSWQDDIIHTHYHEVSSYIESDSLRSDYIPYHSAVNLDNPNAIRVDSHTLYDEYDYISTITSYFDQKIANDRTAHGGPDFAKQQAIDFVLLHAQPSQYPYPLLISVTDLLL